LGRFSGAIFTDTGGAIAFNLYTDTKEDVSIAFVSTPIQDWLHEILRSMI